MPVTNAAADRSSSPAAGAAGLTVPGAGSVTHHFFHSFIQIWMPGQGFGVVFPAISQFFWSPQVLRTIGSSDWRTLQ